MENKSKKFKTKRKTWKDECYSNRKPTMRRDKLISEILKLNPRLSYDDIYTMSTPALSNTLKKLLSK